MPLPIAIASDHAGFTLKSHIAHWLTEHGYAVLDLGTNSADSVDYPDFGHAVARAIEEGKAERGIVICGSGIGISIAANRHAHIRCALVHSALEARLARQHNDANVLAMGERIIGIEPAKDAVQAFLNTQFEGGRHQRRVEKI